MDRLTYAIVFGVGWISGGGILTFAVMIPLEAVIGSDFNTIFVAGCLWGTFGTFTGRWMARHATRVEANTEALRAKTAVTMGVGSGDGELFVHGDYESIKAAQEIILRAERLAEALRDALAMLESWHEDFPEHVGDKEPRVIDAARAALHPTAAQGDGHGGE